MGRVPPVSKPRLSTRASEVAHRKRLFLTAYATSGNAEAASVAAGYDEKHARAHADFLKTDSEFWARACAEREKFVKNTEDAHERQVKALISASDDAIKTLEEIHKGAPKDAAGHALLGWYKGAQARVQAAVAILDRAGHKPVERVEATVSWEQALHDITDVNFVEVLRDAIESEPKDTPALLEHEPS